MPTPTDALSSHERYREAERLELYRREVWGRMDAWVALFGVACPAATAVLMWQAPPLEAAFGIGGIAVFLAYLFRQPWAREALFALPLAGLGLAVPHGLRTVEIALGAGLAGTGLVALAYFDPRNRLAFRLPVSDDALRALESAAREGDRNGGAA